METITANELKRMFSGEDEFALIDTREIADFYRGHLLGASSTPLSRLEVDIEELVPRRQTLIVLCDWPSALSSRSVLREMGYTNMVALEGGVQGWHFTDNRIFAGWNAIGKAFGSFLARTRSTPTVRAAELDRLMLSSRSLLILDTRTPEEHHEYCIPGALSCPNGETLYRALDAIESHDQLIVTHCAGFTRGIIGAQTLREAGVQNEIVSVYLGTLEWVLDGYTLEEGAFRPLPKPSDPRPALDAVSRLRTASDIPDINSDTLDSWHGDTTRTLYIFDVRSTEEYQSGTFAGAKHVPGGQLLQGVDRHIATRGARVALIDDDGVRAATTGYWLKQMGYRNVYTCTLDAAALSSRKTPKHDSLTGACDYETVCLARAKGLPIVDIRPSVAYRKCHVAGSWFLSRRQLAADIQQLPDGPLMLVADEPAFARLMSKDLDQLGRQSSVCIWSSEGFKKSGIELESGYGRLASEPTDAVYDLEDLSVHLRDSHEYILWRDNLYDILDDDPAAPYVRK